MNEKFNKNAKLKKITTMLGIAVRLIVIVPLLEEYGIDFSVSWHNPQGNPGYGVLIRPLYPYNQSVCPFIRNRMLNLLKIK